MSNEESHVVPVHCKSPTDIRIAKRVDGERKTTLCFFARLMFEKGYLRPFSHSLTLSSEFCSVLNNALRSKTHE